MFATVIFLQHTLSILYCAFKHLFPRVTKPLFLTLFFPCVLIFKTYSHFILILLVDPLAKLDKKIMFLRFITFNEWQFLNNQTIQNEMWKSFVALKSNQNDQNKTTIDHQCLTLPLENPNPFFLHSQLI